MYTRDRLKYLIPVWVVFVIICILGSPMNEAWGETPLLDLPRGNFYNEMLRILHIGNGALPAFTMGGVILSLISTKYRQAPATKRAVYTSLAVAVFFLAGVISRQFWILAKIGATPTWVFFVTAISIGTYAILNWLAEKGKAYWFNIIKPAGTATLTCYLIPYVWYGLCRYYRVCTTRSAYTWLSGDYQMSLLCPHHYRHNLSGGTGSHQIKDLRTEIIH